MGKGHQAEGAALRWRLKGRTHLTEEELALLGKWETAVTLQRRKSWRKYVLTQNSKGGGALYKWVQRSNMEPHLTTLKPGPQGAPNNLTTRLRQATEVWGDLWKGGRPHTTHPGDPLPPLTGADIRNVLNRLSGKRARGPDEWGPEELLTLPPSWTDRLAEFYNEWEHNNSWPQELLTCAIA